VLGGLLGVGEEFDLQGRVLGGGRAPGPGAGDRVGHRPAFGHRDQGLRAGADDVEALQAQQIQIRTGIRPAQHPVDVEGIDWARGLEPLAGHDLEHLPGPDLLDRRGDGGLELAARALPPHRWDGPVDPHRDQRFGWTPQGGDHRPDPRAGILVGVGDPLTGVVEVDRVGHQPHLAGVVVEHGHVGDEHHHQLGDAQVVGVAVGQALQPAGDVVAQVADHARDQGRQPRLPRRVQRSQSLGQHRQGIAAGGQPGDLMSAPPGLAVGLAERGCAGHADEGVPGPHPALRRLQQEGVRPVGAQLVVQPDRGEVVSQQPGVHADHATLGPGGQETRQVGNDPDAVGVLGGVEGRSHPDIVAARLQCLP